MTNGAQWETCTGTFYDSGGAGGNYASNESMTATLCPVGGPGSGPFTSVTFTTWSIGLTDLLDNLVIHNGENASDPVLANGSLLNSLQGQTFTSTDPSGCLTFVWTSDAVINSAGWAAEIHTGPDAGGNGSITVCSSAADFDLFGVLTGSPDAGGQWTFSGNLVSNTFSPATSPGGVYTYTVPAVAPCVEAFATVTVTKVAAANAGFDNAIEVCSSEAAFSMRSRLLGAPQTGGAWTFSGNNHVDQFNPATDVGGVYTYLVAGSAPCANASAQLTITLVQAQGAGTNGTLNVCSTAPAQDLFASLGGTPAPGGTWTKPGNLPHNGQFIPGTDAAGIYTYHVAGQAPCTDATATVTVTVQSAASPGTSTSTTLCSNGASVNIKTLLGTTATGTWSGPSTVTGNLYSPSMTPGTYTFTVAATGVCPSSFATVDVTEVLAPDAGINGTLAVCSSGANVDLFTRLGGTPNAGGSWTAPGNVAFPTGIFIPGTSTAGTYTYTVTGTAPCASDVATVVVTQVPAPNAGTNGSITLCSDNAPVDMFSALGTGVTPGGTWYKPVPPGGTVAGSFYNPALAGLPAGVYKYVVLGTNPCPNDTATVTIVENQAPNAGTNGTLTLCNTGAAVNLISALGGSPGGSGSWLGPTNQPFPTGQFDPATGSAGVYKYIIAGAAPCINDTGFVTMTVHLQPNAGFSGDTTVCSDDQNFELITVLNGTPGGSGQWSPGNGTYDCGTGQAGGFTYTITATAPCVNASAVATVTEVQRPNPGGDGTVTVCSTAPPFNLFGSLSGNPQPGGTWSPGAASGVFTPGTSTGGLYTYTLPGTTPCANSTATVNVTLNTAPDPGTDGAITICAGAGILNLFNELGGSPDLGGTWTSLDNIAPGSMTNGLFTHTGVAAGTYDFRYAVNASGGCPGDFAEVHVTITASFDAGTNGNCNVCKTNTAYNLFSCLNGTPQQGGTWKRWPGGTTVSQLYNASADAPGGPYIFRYYLTGAVGCQTDSAQVNITVIAAPEAGPATASVTYCSSGSIASLITNLPGASGGGTWKKQGQPGVGTGNYNPPLSDPFNSPGLFYYIVLGSAPCASDTAKLTVAEVVAPNAGTTPMPITRCILSPAFNMTLELGGAPASNGTWTTPQGAPHTSTFVPGVDQGGTWTYTVPGTQPCSNATAQLNITIAQQPNAGLDGTENVCSDGPGFLFSTVLNGTFNAGGTWYDSLGTVVVTPFFDPDPATTGENVFTYVVTGTAPCLNDTATIYIFESKEADAGITTSVEHCPTNGALDLFDELGGTPDATGTWTNGFNGTYVPGISTPGVPYTYTVTGVPPCSSASASVTVIEVEPPFAGLNTSVLVCTSDDPFGLASALDGDPDPGGVWNGQPSLVFFDPGANAPGAYQFTYVVEGDGTCLNDTATLTITLFQEVDAGCNGTLQLCSISPPTPLFPSLGCSPQAGGIWKRPGGQSHNGIFNPATDPVGIYTYRRAGNAACPADSATVTVSVVQQPNAGTSGQGFACSDQAPFPLINLLSGNPQPGGTWTNQQGNPHSEFYVPQVDSSGTFTYTVAGITPCSSSSAQVNVIEYQRPFAGNDGFRQVCSDEAGSFALITVLTGGPNPVGTWYAPGGAAYPQGTFDPGATAPGQYTYVVQGNAPCPSDTAKATILQTTAPEAGISTAVQTCNTPGAVSLNDLLAGSSDAGGIWYGPDGQVHSSTFNPAIDPPGTYKYKVIGISPCASDSATVTISLVSQPNAGTSGALGACINDSSVPLFPGLGGSPQTTGTWSGANQVNGIFNATQVAPGPYVFTYTVSGGGACPASQAQVTVTVTAALDAGDGGSGTVCSGTQADLFTFLTGTPQPGGIWRDLDNTGALASGGLFNAGIAGVGEFDFRYVHPGSANCPGDSVQIVVTVVPGPDAGSNSTVPMCSNANQLSLTSLLGGSPDTDGQWFGPTFNPISAQFNPATGAGGLYTYVVTGDAGCANDSATVLILLSTAPNAGGNASFSICSNSDPADLFPILSGAPQTGGTWTCCGGVGHSGTYVPFLDNTGQYVYTVTGQGACPNASATVFVTEQVAPNAGMSNTYEACSSAGIFNLTAQLIGAPNNGTWSAPGGATHPNTFNPAVDSSGIYIYTVTGGSSCMPATATLTVVLTYTPDAGNDSTLAVCSTEAAVDLFLALGPDADTGGTWVDVTGVGSALQGSIFDASAVGLGTYLFGYSLPGSGQCLGDADTVTVVVGSGLDPGIGGDDTICGGDVAHDMFGSLGGDPDTGGIWASGSVPGVLTGSLLNATLLPPGGPYPFSYTVTDPGCGEASSVVFLIISEFADPGADTTITVCSTANPFGLFNVLGGDPDVGGTWTTLNGVPVSATFNPAMDNSGSFRYNLSGTAPCNDTSAVITITVNDPPQAGADNTLLECNSGSLNLDSVLLPGAQPGGNWVDNGNTGGLVGHILDLDTLDAGQHPFTYIVVVTACGTDMASYLLTAAEAVSLSDTVLTCNEQDRTYTVSVTIEGGDPATYSVTGLEGTIIEGPPSIFTSSPILTSQSFSMVVTDTNDCGPRMLEGTSPCDFDEAVFVPESFTPNGDDVNDVFVIPGIEGYPDNTIDIFNRWGGEVYSAAGYDNKTVVWDGTAERALLSGDLPTGTYYYVLELGNGVEPLKGFVYLNR